MAGPILDAMSWARGGGRYGSGTCYAGIAGYDAWHLGRYGPQGQLWWLGFAFYDSTRTVFSLFVDWPRVLSIVVDMEKKDSYAVQRLVLRFWWFATCSVFQRNVCSTVDPIFASVSVDTFLGL